MKRLKFLLIPLISLLFIINVNAQADVQLTYYNLTSADNYLNTNSNKSFNDFIELVLSKIDIPSISDDEKYIYFLSNYPGYSNELYLDILVGSDITIGTYAFSNPTFTIGFNSFTTDYRYTLSFQNNSYTDNNLVVVGSLTTTPTFYTNYALERFASIDKYIIKTNVNEIHYTTPTNTQNSFQIGSSSEYNFNSYIPIDLFKGSYNYSIIEDFSLEPTYSYTSTILDNGNVKLDFTFNNYTSDSGYAFEIENYVSNEEYGITNTYSSIFPNQIPFGSSYSIELSYDSLLYVTLAKYEQVEQTSLYSREEIYTNMIDINNVVFENEQEPYFVIYRQTKNLIEGSFVNITSNNTCWYRYSTSQNEDFVPCDEMLGLSFYDNGYIEVLIKKGSTTIYSRKINYLGSTSNEPYIIYNITKQDFYSVLNFSVENYVNGLTYRVSTDNGINFSNWQTYDNTKNNFINVFDNSTIIIEIANSNQSTIYDSKSIVVVNNINEIKSINNTTTNFLDKFRSIFNVNTNILRNINNFYDNIKLSKIYLLIFIPFLASLIGAIIYLIRRK